MNPDSWEHDMDDLIMEVTICQDKHRVDRSAPPKVRLSGFLSQDGRTTIYQRALQKVVLLSLDRNRELSLLTSNHTSFASRRRHDVLILPVRGTSRELWVGE